MKKIKINGGKTLKGTIDVSGAKNSAVALIPASILCDEEVIIDNIPRISDIDALNEILTYLGAHVTYENDAMKIDSKDIVNKEIPESISTKLRASYYFMSALLGKYKRVQMYFPGGCKIGSRPIDQTLKAFELLGAKVEEEDNRYTITAKKLIGTNIYLDMPSVGATINAILVAARAEGKTVIENAAKEPEIVSVATFLNNMGAHIRGAGTSKITIEGVDHLTSAFTEVIPDRIEAGTYVLAGALLGKDLTIRNLIPKHIESLTSKLKEIGTNIEVGIDYVKVSRGEILDPIKLKTLGYPGFPTDLQQPMTVLLTQCQGISTLQETIYENRFQNVPYLNKMGAYITVSGDTLTIFGPTKLSGAEVVATDLRAGACLVLAGLVADGETIIDEAEHILRGYENIAEKLQNVGAKIEII